MELPCCRVIELQMEHVETDRPSEPGAPKQQKADESPTFPAASNRHDKPDVSGGDFVGSPPRRTDRPEKLYLIRPEQGRASPRKLNESRQDGKEAAFFGR